jgi:hypothetical protein
VSLNLPAVKPQVTFSDNLPEYSYGLPARKDWRMEPIVTSTEKFMELLPYIIPLVLLQLTLMIVALVDLTRRERTRGPKWVWILVIVFGELIGPIIYFIFGRQD